MSAIQVSVVMPVFNRESYVADAIESILNQTLKEFEFIIVDDGSTDKTQEIIRSFNDSRIIYVKNAENQGNAISRNKGMNLAKGKYIAIMDSDDISVPNRLELQYRFLESHPEMDILGGGKVFFTPNEWFIKIYPSDPEYIKAFLFFKNVVGQPTVMMRRDSLVKANLCYAPANENMEDYHLWYRAAMEGLRISSLPQVLLYYRVSDSQMGSASNIHTRIPKLTAFFRSRLHQLGIDLPEEEFLLLHHFVRGRIELDHFSFALIGSLLDHIERSNQYKKLFDRQAFRAALFYFRLRLIKYRFLENGKYLQFVLRFLRLIQKTGRKALLLFWHNEGRFMRSTGENQRNTGDIFSDTVLIKQWLPR